MAITNKVLHYRPVNKGRQILTLVLLGVLGLTSIAMGVLYALKEGGLSNVVNSVVVNIDGVSINEEGQYKVAKGGTYKLHATVLPNEAYESDPTLEWEIKSGAGSAVLSPDINEGGKTLSATLIIGDNTNVLDGTLIRVAVTPRSNRKAVKNLDFVISDIHVDEVSFISIANEPIVDGVYNYYFFSEPTDEEYPEQNKIVRASRKTLNGGPFSPIPYNDLVFTSSNPNIVSISKSDREAAVMQPHAKGEATITVSLEGNPAVLDTFRVVLHDKPRSFFMTATKDSDIEATEEQLQKMFTLEYAFDKPAEQINLREYFYVKPIETMEQTRKEIVFELISTRETNGEEGKEIGFINSYLLTTGVLAAGSSNKEGTAIIAATHPLFHDYTINFTVQLNMPALNIVVKNGSTTIANSENVSQTLNMVSGGKADLSVAITSFADSVTSSLDFDLEFSRSEYDLSGNTESGSIIDISGDMAGDYLKFSKAQNLLSFSLTATTSYSVDTTLYVKIKSRHNPNLFATFRVDIRVIVYEVLFNPAQIERLAERSIIIGGAFGGQSISESNYTQVNTLEITYARNKELQIFSILSYIPDVFTHDSVKIELVSGGSGQAHQIASANNDYTHKSSAVTESYPIEYKIYPTNMPSNFITLRIHIVDGVKKNSFIISENTFADTIADLVYYEDGTNTPIDFPKLAVTYTTEGIQTATMGTVQFTITNTSGVSLYHSSQFISDIAGMDFDRWVFRDADNKILFTIGSSTNIANNLYNYRYCLTVFEPILNESKLVITMSFNNVLKGTAPLTFNINYKSAIQKAQIDLKVGDSIIDFDVAEEKYRNFVVSLNTVYKISPIIEHFFNTKDKETYSLTYVPHVTLHNSWFDQATNSVSFDANAINETFVIILYGERDELFRVNIVPVIVERRIDAIAVQDFDYWQQNNSMMIANNSVYVKSMLNDGTLTFNLSASYDDQDIFTKYELNILSGTRSDYIDVTVSNSPAGDNTFEFSIFVDINSLNAANSQQFFMLSFYKPNIYLNGNRISGTTVTFYIEYLNDATAISYNKQSQDSSVVNLFTNDTAQGRSNSFELSPRLSDTAQKTSSTLEYYFTKAADSAVFDGEGNVDDSVLENGIAVLDGDWLRAVSNGSVWLQFYIVNKRPDGSVVRVRQVPPILVSVVSVAEGLVDTITNFSNRMYKGKTQTISFSDFVFEEGEAPSKTEFTIVSSNEAVVKITDKTITAFDVGTCGLQFFDFSGKLIKTIEVSVFIEATSFVVYVDQTYALPDSGKYKMATGAISKFTIAQNIEVTSNIKPGFEGYYESGYEIEVSEPEGLSFMSGYFEAVKAGVYTVTFRVPDLVKGEGYYKESLTRSFIIEVIKPIVNLSSEITMDLKTAQSKEIQASLDNFVYPFTPQRDTYFTDYSNYEGQNKYRIDNASLVGSTLTILRMANNEGGNLYITVEYSHIYVLSGVTKPVTYRSETIIIYSDTTEILVTVTANGQEIDASTEGNTDVYTISAEDARGATVVAALNWTAMPPSYTITYIDPRDGLPKSTLTFDFWKYATLEIPITIAGTTVAGIAFSYEKTIKLTVTGPDISNVGNYHTSLSAAQEQENVLKVVQGDEVSLAEPDLNVDFSYIHEIIASSVSGLAQLTDKDSDGNFTKIKFNHQTNGGTVTIVLIITFGDQDSTIMYYRTFEVAAAITPTLTVAASQNILAGASLDLTPIETVNTAIGNTDTYTLTKTVIAGANLIDNTLTVNVLTDDTIYAKAQTRGGTVNIRFNLTITDGPYKGFVIEFERAYYVQPTVPVDIVFLAIANNKHAMSINHTSSTSFKPVSVKQGGQDLTIDVDYEIEYSYDDTYFTVGTDGKITSKTVIGTTPLEVIVKILVDGRAGIYAGEITRSYTIEITAEAPSFDFSDRESMADTLDAGSEIEHGTSIDITAVFANATEVAANQASSNANIIYWLDAAGLALGTIDTTDPSAVIFTANLKTTGGVFTVYAQITIVGGPYDGRSYIISQQMKVKTIATPSFDSFPSNIVLINGETKNFNNLVSATNLDVGSAGFTFTEVGSYLNVGTLSNGVLTVSDNPTAGVYSMLVTATITGGAYDGYTFSQTFNFTVIALRVTPANSTIISGGKTALTPEFLAPSGVHDFDPITSTVYYSFSGDNGTAEVNNNEFTAINDTLHANNYTVTVTASTTVEYNSVEYSFSYTFTITVLNLNVAITSNTGFSGTDNDEVYAGSVLSITVKNAAATINNSSASNAVSVIAGGSLGTLTYNSFTINTNPTVNTTLTFEFIVRIGGVPYYYGTRTFTVLPLAQGIDQIKLTNIDTPNSYDSDNNILVGKNARVKLSLDLDDGLSGIEVDSLTFTANHGTIESGTIFNANGYTGLVTITARYKYKVTSGGETYQIWFEKTYDFTVVDYSNLPVSIVLSISKENNLILGGSASVSIDTSSLEAGYTASDLSFDDGSGIGNEQIDANAIIFTYTPTAADTGRTITVSYKVKGITFTTTLTIKTIELATPTVGLTNSAGGALTQGTEYTLTATVSGVSGTDTHTITFKVIDGVGLVDETYLDESNNLILNNDPDKADIKTKEHLIGGTITVMVFVTFTSGTSPFYGVTISDTIILTIAAPNAPTMELKMVDGEGELQDIATPMPIDQDTSITIVAVTENITELDTISIAVLSGSNLINPIIDEENENGYNTYKITILSPTLGGDVVISITMTINTAPFNDQSITKIVRLRVNSPNTSELALTAVDETLTPVADAGTTEFANATKTLTITATIDNRYTLINGAFIVDRWSGVSASDYSFTATSTTAVFTFTKAGTIEITAIIAYKDASNILRHATKTVTYTIALSEEADNVATTINGLPAVGDLTHGDLDDLIEAEGSLANLNANHNNQATTIADTLLTKIADLRHKMDALIVDNELGGLTTAASVWFDDDNALVAYNILLNTIETARQNYEELDQAQKNIITNLTKLTDLEARVALLKELEPLYDFAESYNGVTVMLTQQHQDDITAIYTLYSALNLTQDKVDVLNLDGTNRVEIITTKYDDLQDLKDRLEQFKDDLNNLANEGVSSSPMRLDWNIGNISNASGTFKTAVARLRDEYDALFVTGYSELAYIQLKTLANDGNTPLNQILAKAKEAVDVIVLIEGLTSFDSDDIDAINAAKQAYDALGATYIDKYILIDDTDKIKTLAQNVVDYTATENFRNAVQAIRDEVSNILDDITLDNEPLVIAAKQAYQLLSDNQKLLVPAYEDDYIIAVAKIADLNDTPANAIITRIAGIYAEGEDIDDLTANDRGRIHAIWNDYNALSASQKALVTNISALTAALKRVDDLFAIDPVVNALTSLMGLVTFDGSDENREAIVTQDKVIDIQTRIELIDNAISGLTEDQEDLIPANLLADLELIRTATENIEGLAESAAQAVEALITGIKTALTNGDWYTLNNMELGHGTDIIKARTAYNALTAYEKSFVDSDNVTLLESFLTKLTELKVQDFEQKVSAITHGNQIADIINLYNSDLEEHEKALAILAYNDLMTKKTNYDATLVFRTKLVAIIGEEGNALIETTDEAAIAEARAEFDKLNTAQVALIDTEEAALLQAEVDLVIAFIEDLGSKIAGKTDSEIFDQQYTYINEINARYIALSDIQKQDGDLTTACTALTGALDSLNTIDGEITSLITAIGSLSNNNNEDFKLDAENLRTRYDLLSDNQKALVTNYARLQAAEEAIVIIEDIAKIATLNKAQVNTLYQDYLKLSQTAKTFISQDEVDTLTEKFNEFNTDAETIVDSWIEAINITKETLTIVNYKDYEGAINAAYTLYDGLSALQKTTVDPNNVTKITELNTKLTNILAAVDVYNRIIAINANDTFDGSLLADIRTAYEGLGTAVKAVIDDVDADDILTTAETNYNATTELRGDIDTARGITKYTATNKTTINNAINAYNTFVADAENAAKTRLISSVYGPKVTELEALLAQFEIIELVVNAINDYETPSGDLTAGEIVAVEKLEKDYTDLGDLKALIDSTVKSDVETKLGSIRTALDGRISTASGKAAEFEAKITTIIDENAIESLTIDILDAVRSARGSYTALTAYEKTLTSEETLLKLEAKVVALEFDEKVDDVLDKAKEVGFATYLEDLREEYDDLSALAKSYVKTHNDLLVYEYNFGLTEDFRIAYEEVANIGETTDVDLSNKNTIEDARNEYNRLTADQKKLVVYFDEQLELFETALKAAIIDDLEATINAFDIAAIDFVNVAQKEADFYALVSSYSALVDDTTEIEAKKTDVGNRVADINTNMATYDLAVKLINALTASGGDFNATILADYESLATMLVDLDADLMTALTSSISTFDTIYSAATEHHGKLVAFEARIDAIKENDWNDVKEAHIDTVKQIESDYTNLPVDLQLLVRNIAILNKFVAVINFYEAIEANKTNLANLATLFDTYRSFNQETKDFATDVYGGLVNEYKKLVDFDAKVVDYKVTGTLNATEAQAIIGAYEAYLTWVAEIQAEFVSELGSVNINTRYADALRALYGTNVAKLIEDINNINVVAMTNDSTAMTAYLNGLATAYDALSTEARAMVFNYSQLTAAIAAYEAELSENGFIYQVKALMEIPSIATANREAIELARAAYSALTINKALVAYYESELSTIETTLAPLMVTEITNTINAFEATITLDNVADKKTEINKHIDDFALFGGIYNEIRDKVESINERIAEVEKANDAVIELQAFIDNIDTALTTEQYTDLVEIIALLDTFDSGDQTAIKGKVTDIETYEAAHATYTAVEGLITTIDGMDYNEADLSNVDNKTAIANANSALNSLGEFAQFVTNKQKLLNYVVAVAFIDQVTAAIAGEIVLADLTAAFTTYRTLNAATQTLVANAYDDLKAAYKTEVNFDTLKGGFTTAATDTLTAAKAQSIVDIYEEYSSWVEEIKAEFRTELANQNPTINVETLYTKALEVSFGSTVGDIIYRISQIEEEAKKEGFGTWLEQLETDYNALSDEQKALVSNSDKLTAATMAYETELADGGFIHKVKAFESQSITTGYKTAIETARAAYEALTPAQQKLVAYYNNLLIGYEAQLKTAIETENLENYNTAYGELNNNYATMNKTALETALTNLTAAFNVLSDTQKAGVQVEHNALVANVEEYILARAFTEEVTAAANDLTKLEEAYVAYGELEADIKAIDVVATAYGELKNAYIIALDTAISDFVVDTITYGSDNTEITGWIARYAGLGGNKQETETKITAIEERIAAFAAGKAFVQSVDEASGLTLTEMQAAFTAHSALEDYVQDAVVSAYTSLINAYKTLVDFSAKVTDFAVANPDNITVEEAKKVISAYNEYLTWVADVKKEFESSVSLSESGVQARYNSAVSVFADDLISRIGDIESKAAQQDFEQYLNDIKADFDTLNANEQVNVTNSAALLAAIANFALTTDFRTAVSVINAPASQETEIQNARTEYTKLSYAQQKLVAYYNNLLIGYEAQLKTAIETENLENYNTAYGELNNNYATMNKTALEEALTNLTAAFEKLTGDQKGTVQAGTSETYEANYNALVINVNNHIAKHEFEELVTAAAAASDLTKLEEAYVAYGQLEADIKAMDVVATAYTSLVEAYKTKLEDEIENFVVDTITYGSETSIIEGITGWIADYKKLVADESLENTVETKITEIEERIQFIANTTALHNTLKGFADITSLTLTIANYAAIKAAWEELDGYADETQRSIITKDLNLTDFNAAYALVETIVKINEDIEGLGNNSTAVDITTLEGSYHTFMNGNSELTSLITNYSKLENYVAGVEFITAVGTIEDETDLAALTTQYNALDGDVKLNTAVSTAKTTLDGLIADEADEAAVEHVKSLIDTFDANKDETNFLAAYNAYNALRDDLQSRVTNYSTILATYVTAYNSTAAFRTIMGLLTGVTNEQTALAHKSLIEIARGLYATLDDNAKPLVSEYESDLAGYEGWLTAAQNQAVYDAAYGALDTFIAKTDLDFTHIAEINSLIEELEAAYDALSGDQQTEANDGGKHNTLIASAEVEVMTAYNDVYSELSDLIGTANYDDIQTISTKIQNLETAYAALSEGQKTETNASGHETLISTANTKISDLTTAHENGENLTAYNEAYAALTEEEEGIPAYKKMDLAALQSRLAALTAAFDKLSDNQKETAQADPSETYQTNYDNLVAEVNKYIAIREYIVAFDEFVTNNGSTTYDNYNDNIVLEIKILIAQFTALNETALAEVESRESLNLEAQLEAYELKAKDYELFVATEDFRTAMTDLLAQYDDDVTPTWDLTANDVALVNKANDEYANLSKKQKEFADEYYTTSHSKSAIDLITDAIAFLAELQEATEIETLIGVLQGKFDGKNVSELTMPDVEEIEEAHTRYTNYRGRVTINSGKVDNLTELKTKADQARLELTPLRMSEIEHSIETVVQQFATGDFAATTVNELNDMIAEIEGLIAKLNEQGQQGSQQAQGMAFRLVMPMSDTTPLTVEELIEMLNELKAKVELIRDVVVVHEVLSTGNQGQVTDTTIQETLDKVAAQYPQVFEELIVVAPEEPTEPAEEYTPSIALVAVLKTADYSGWGLTNEQEKFILAEYSKVIADDTGEVKITALLDKINENEGAEPAKTKEDLEKLIAAIEFNQALKDRILDNYNKMNDIYDDNKGNHPEAVYEVAEASSPFYTLIARNVSSLTSVKIGDSYVLDSTKEFTISMGYNKFMKFYDYVLDGSKLYIATTLLVFEVIDSGTKIRITINEKGREFDTIPLPIKDVAVNNSGGTGGTMDKVEGEENEYTFKSASGTSYFWVNFDFEELTAANRILTKRIKTDTTNGDVVSFGSTDMNALNGGVGYAFYAFGWRPSNIYELNPVFTYDITIYIIGVGVARITVNCEWTGNVPQE